MFAFGRDKMASVPKKDKKNRKTQRGIKNKSSSENSWQNHTKKGHTTGNAFTSP